MDTSRIHVAVRLRPKLPSESAEADAVAVVKDKLQLLYAPWTRLNTSYQFDRVFQPHHTNAQIFDSFLTPIVQSVLNGNHASIMAYGQTGTGKTHTMLGRDLWGLCSTNNPQQPSLVGSQDNGLMYLVAAELLQHCGALQCSYLELYNDKVYDLLDDGTKGTLEVREEASIGAYVPEAQLLDISSIDALMEILWKGAQTRAHRATNMNERSSRSHTILQLTVNDGANRINLVDLAGSEKCKSMSGDGQHVKELKFINQSLSNLGHCISALLKRGRHIPYRNCKLTRLLQHSLDGKALCSFIVTLNPCASNTMETLSTLQFAARAMKVKVRNTDATFKSMPSSNNSSCEATLLQQQILQLQAENKTLRTALVQEREQKGKLLLGFTSLLRDTSSVERIDTSTQVRRESLNANQISCNNQASHPHDEFILSKLSMLESTIQRQLQDIQATKEQLLQPKADDVVSNDNQWEEYVDATTGYKYFHNASTGITQWKKPSIFYSS